MPNHFSLSKKQALALKRVLPRMIGSSVDALTKEVGQEDAFTLFQLKERLEKIEA